MEWEHIYKEILSAVSDGVYIVDMRRKILFWNKAAERITGYSAEEIMGEHCAETGLHHVDMHGEPLCELGCPLVAATETGKVQRERVFVRHKEGYRVPIETQVFPVYRNGVDVGAVDIFRPVSGRVYDDHLIEQLSDAATRDPLTGLSNRRYLRDYLQYKLYASRQFGKKFAVLFGDVDDFHQFNNTYGHDAGDSVLKNIARTFRENLRAGDRVARWGGEEFVGVFAVRAPADVRALGQKMCQLVRNTEIDHAGHPLHATMSIGITLMRPEDTVETMLARADALMYESKRKGKDCVTAG
ncbi:MAG: GGDEF domain-containing protein [Selenomonadaceae bacterium]|nr:GGDEF domain-containing protein [Selenomonadaceae bacterium]